MEKKRMSKHNIVLIFAVVALSISVITLSILLFNKKDTKDYYSIKCESYAVQNANLSQGQIVFIGDSITDLYHLDSYYNNLDLATYNRGISGDTTLGVKNRLQVSLFDIKPSKIVLMIGTNDILFGRTVSDTLATYREVVELIYTNLPDVELYLMSVIPQNYDLQKTWSYNVDDSMLKINELNLNIESLSNEFGSTYVDIYNDLLDDSGYLNKKYSDDGLHLNHEGFVVWTNKIKDYLK